MTNRTFYKKTITVEFLSETPIPDLGLGKMVDEAINGDYSMNVTIYKTDELDGKQAADALLDHASDPSFFHQVPE
jgi:hypothetical protein